MNDEHKPDAFDAALREWGERPPRTPAGIAARRAVAALPEPRAAMAWLRPALVAATLLLAVAAGWLISGGAHPARPTVAELTPPPLDDDVVLWWIDPETPVYFVLPRTNSEKGDVS